MIRYRCDIVPTQDYYTLGIVSEGLGLRGKNSQFHRKFLAPTIGARSVTRSRKTFNQAKLMVFHSPITSLTLVLLRYIALNLNVPKVTSDASMANCITKLSVFVRSYLETFSKSPPKEVKTEFVALDDITQHDTPVPAV